MRATSRRKTKSIRPGSVAGRALERFPVELGVQVVRLDPADPLEDVHVA
jgi:hypothetical protein